MSTQHFEIERTYDAPVKRVWEAISDKDRMKQWYFDIPEFKAEVGAEFEFEGGPPEKSYRHLCMVKEVIPEKKLSYSWRYDGYPGNSLVTFELFPEGENRTRLKLTHTGLETFPADTNPDLAAKNFAMGWTDIIGKNLPDFVETDSLNHTVELPAEPAKVWNVLTEPAAVRSWAGAFGEGVYAETSWKKGAEVAWMDGNGSIGVKGLVEENDPQKTLRVRFFDDVNSTDPAELGDYVEEYRLAEKDGKTVLNISTGPLSRKDIAGMSPMWDDAIKRIKELASEK
jgi:uncharacterized protein YndB with AHSA1/START domain